MPETRQPAPVLPTTPVPEAQLLAGLPAPWPVDAAEPAALAAAGRRLVVLDDDPTGTQAVADVPVLTAWAVDDLRWALRRPSSGFFVLTNTRSLDPDQAASRTREVVTALAEAARAEGIGYTLLSRSDSTLRGHFPLETDVLAEQLAEEGVSVDAVVVCPAFVEPGRITLDSVHWMRTAGGMLPVGESEFARDATFGYTRSDLPGWVEEKTGGRIRAEAVLRITLDDVRRGGPDRVLDLLAGARDGRVVVTDAVSEEDLQVIAVALLRAEAQGRTFLLRTGPGLVRARCGQRASAPLDPARLRRLGGAAEPGRPASPRGLVVVGSHVGLTTRQLDRLRAAGGLVEVELEVAAVLDAARRDAHVRDVAERVLAELTGSGPDADVVVRTSRTLVTGRDRSTSLAIARAVSAASVEVVRRVTAAVRPAFVIAKGGITSSDTATGGLGIRRAWARGTLLPGIVSLWEPVDGPAAGVPYVVFPGNVGDDEALADVRALLHS